MDAIAERARVTMLAADTAHESDPLSYLEADQLVVERRQPVGRAVLSRRSRVLLWGLRVSGIGLGAMVIYTFASQLTG